MSPKQPVDVLGQPELSQKKIPSPLWTIGGTLAIGFWDLSVLLNYISLVLDNKKLSSETMAGQYQIPPSYGLSPLVLIIAIALIVIGWRNQKLKWLSIVNITLLGLYFLWLMVEVFAIFWACGHGC